MQLIFLVLLAPSYLAWWYTFRTLGKATGIEFMETTATFLAIFMVLPLAGLGQLMGHQWIFYVYISLPFAVAGFCFYWNLAKKRVKDQ